MADVAADLAGPNVVFHHSKLNFKWPKGGQVFDWHHDINAWPHTDYSPVTIGLYLEDCGPEEGPLKVSIPAPIQMEARDLLGVALGGPESEVEARLGSLEGLLAGDRKLSSLAREISLQFGVPRHAVYQEGLDIKSEIDKSG